MFLETIYRRASRKPGERAVITLDRSITNAELWADLSSLAAWFAREGLRRGDTVGISVREQYRNLVATLAAMRAGLRQIALPTHDPADVRGELAKRLRLAAVLAEDSEYGLAGIPTLVPDTSFRDGKARRGLGADAVSADEECFFLSSSGTTGRAKIIPLSQRQLFLQAARAQLRQGRYVLYRPASIEFNNGRRHILYCLATGGTGVLVSPHEMSIPEICRRFGVTILGLSAAQAQALIDTPGREPLPERTEVQVRGSPVSAELRQRIMHRLTPRLAVGYGTSEFGSVATAGPADHRRHPATVGRTHGGVELEIVDDHDRPVPLNVWGRIRLRGPGMATRYHDDDEATSKAFRDGWFYPGDAGHVGEAGDLRFEGRADDMMILGSINIFPSEIERVCESLPGVIECAAFSIRSGAYGDIPLLAVVGDGTASAAALLSAARRALGLRAPRKVLMVRELPRSAEGKVLRRELQKLVDGRAAA